LGKIAFKSKYDKILFFSFGKKYTWK
jgi:hypothetical protein